MATTNSIIDTSDGIENTRIEAFVRKRLQRFETDRRVLLMVPDATRQGSLAGFIGSCVFRELTRRCEVVAMPTLGTHRSDAETRKAIEAMYPGIPSRHFYWNRDVETLATLPAAHVKSLTNGIADAPLKIQINCHVVRGAFDRVISIGQVVPHEVTGFANGNKNLYIGAGGADFINQSHWVGALFGIENTLGRINTPTRRLLNAAASIGAHHLPPVSYFLTVRDAKYGPKRTVGLFVGECHDTFVQAANLSGRVNIDRSKDAFDKIVVRLPPEKFTTCWTAGKAIYRTRMAVKPGGQIVVIAPGLVRAGENDAQQSGILKYGYCGTSAVKRLVEMQSELADNLGIAAHLIHASTEGDFSVRYYTPQRFQGEIRGQNYTHLACEDANELMELPVGRLMRGSERWLVIDDPGMGLWQQAGSDGEVAV